MTERLGGHTTTARCLFRYLKRFWGTRSYPQNILAWKGWEHSKVVFSMPTPVAPEAFSSLRDGNRIRNFHALKRNQNGISRNIHEIIWKIRPSNIIFAPLDYSLNSRYWRWHDALIMRWLVKRWPNGYLESYPNGYMVINLNGRMYIYPSVNYNLFTKRHFKIRHISTMGPG